jgi:hypothetical protein
MIIIIFHHERILPGQHVDLNGQRDKHAKYPSFQVSVDSTCRRLPDKKSIYFQTASLSSQQPRFFTDRLRRVVVTISENRWHAQIIIYRCASAALDLSSGSVCVLLLCAGVYTIESTFVIALQFDMYCLLPSVIHIYNRQAGLVERSLSFLVIAMRPCWFMMEKRI